MQLLLEDSVTLDFLRVVCSFILANLIGALEHILFAVVVYLLVCLGIYKLLFTKRKRFNLNIIKNVKFPYHERVLVVISHPDDECMFFGPTIRSLLKRDNCQLYLLCLSNGNYNKKGKIRREELYNSCATLGITESNIILMNVTCLPDDPNTEWRVESVAKIIMKIVECLDIEAVVTFDRDGVSQHPNHCAIYYAISSLCLAQIIPKDCKIYTLDSINVIRKYISIFDLLCTFLMSTNRCILNWNEASVIRSAMKQHKSQMLWFRWLYILFSRYIFINSLREVTLSDIELEMQIQDS